MGLIQEENFMFDQDKQTLFVIDNKDAFKKNYISSINKETNINFNYNKAGKNQGNHFDSTISFLQRHAKVINDTGVFCADFESKSQEEQAKKNKALCKLHDKALTKIMSQINSTRGLDELEKTLARHQKRYIKLESQGKQTHQETLQLQSLEVHNMLAIFTVLQNTCDIDKAKKYLDFYNPIGRKNVNQNSYQQFLEEAATILEADGNYIAGRNTEIVS